VVIPDDNGPDMKFRRILPPPVRFARWTAAAVASGLLTPVIAVTIITLAAYYPIGSWLPTSALLSKLGVILAIVAIAIIILVAGPVFSMLAWSWRPTVLAVIFELSLLAGTPGMIVGDYLQHFAFELLKNRSSVVVHAIANYVRVEGTPPATLSEIVPTYLPSIPLTGMALEPHYKYEARDGPCSFGYARITDWHLSVSVREFFFVHRLFYCPDRGEWLYETSD
jgi:hypothetical protein